LPQTFLELGPLTLAEAAAAQRDLHWNQKASVAQAAAAMVNHQFTLALAALALQTLAVEAAQAGQALVALAAQAS
jgi:hypothetical protein